MGIILVIGLVIGGVVITSAAIITVSDYMYTVSENIYMSVWGVYKPKKRSKRSSITGIW